MWRVLDSPFNHLASERFCSGAAPRKAALPPPWERAGSPLHPAKNRAKIGAKPEFWRFFKSEPTTAWTLGLQPGLNLLQMPLEIAKIPNPPPLLGTEFVPRGRPALKPAHPLQNPGLPGFLTNFRKIFKNLYLRNACRDRAAGGLVGQRSCQPSTANVSCHSASHAAAARGRFPLRRPHRSGAGCRLVQRDALPAAAAESGPAQDGASAQPSSPSASRRIPP